MSCGDSRRNSVFHSVLVPSMDHVPITPPAMKHTDYYNRKGWYSMLVQAVVDHDYLFRDLCVGWPGSVHDARVLANSTLFKKATSGEPLQGEEVQIAGQALRMYLIGDSVYPLLPWLIKPAFALADKAILILFFKFPTKEV